MRRRGRTHRIINSTTELKDIKYAGETARRRAGKIVMRNCGMRERSMACGRGARCNPQIRCAKQGVIRIQSRIRIGGAYTAQSGQQSRKCTSEIRVFAGSGCAVGTAVCECGEL